MSLTFNVVKKNADNTIVLEAKNPSKPQLPAKRYLLPEENSDKFQKAKKGSDTLNKTNQIMTTILSVALGCYVSGKVKSMILSIAAGVAAAGAAILALNKFDSMIQTQSEKNLYKKFDVKEIEKEQG